MSSRDITCVEVIMRIFVTGASGWIGSALIPELIGAGHQVIGLARSDDAVAAVTRLGASVHRGGLEDPESLRAGAEGSDGVVHLAYIHDFSRYEDAAKADLTAVQTMGAVLEGSGRPLLIASGMLSLTSGAVATERDAPAGSSNPRVASAQAALDLAERGVRSGVVRFAPTVHGIGDHGFIATLTNIARDKGVSAYIDDGSSRWPAVHRFDAANLVHLAVDDAPAGSVLHAVAEEGVATRAIAEAIGRSLDLPVASIPAAQAVEHFGFLGRFFGTDCPASNELTRELLGWKPTRAGLIEDIDAGHYAQR
jgi:nucleoside-diphosphate-sugar epimerase